ncbi:MAG: GDP-mannose 4,6-dehydratase [Actinomycetota bacterium]
MKAVITGVGGFVGPHLRDHLTACGDVVVGLDLDNGPDLRDADGWVDRMVDEAPDVIYHLAGWSDVGGSWQEPVATFQVNLMGTISVLEAARRAGTERVVVISSADVYGTVDAATLPLTEAAPVKPRSPYGASKQAAEAAAIQYWRGHGMTTVIARPFNHIGPGQSPKFIAPSFAAQIAAAEATVSAGDGTGPAPIRHGDLTPRRDLTDVRDVVRAYRLLAERGRGGEVYNICRGETVTMQTLLDSMLTLSDADVQPTPDPALFRPVDLPVLQGSYDKLRAATGWEPTISLTDSLTAVLADARRRRPLPAAGTV